MRNGDASSPPIPHHPGVGKNEVCIDGLGICPNRDEEECKFACFKKWEHLNPVGYCLDVPRYAPLCYCQHMC